MKRLLICCASLLFTCFQQEASAQSFLQKMKNKVNSLTGNNTTPANKSTTANSTGNPTNTTGGGLTNTPPPDVLTNISTAEKLGSDSNYSNARYALQQALMGVEIQLGKKILLSLPGSVDGLNKDTSKNVVMSTQFGWSNMTIETAYDNGSNKQMTVMVGNMPMYAGIVSMYANNSTYIQANNANQNQNQIQQVQVKGNRALISYDKNQGYSLIVELGQGGMIVWACVNFATEDEVMNAANSFDIDGIKKIMGVQ
jgi:hypothetical protein